MRRYGRVALAGVLVVQLVISTCGAQTKEAAPKKVAIRAGRLIDGKSDTPMTNVLILIEGDKIISVTPGGTAPAGVEVIDLSKATVLSGLVDTHTHLLLNGDI